MPLPFIIGAAGAAAAAALTARAIKKSKTVYYYIKNKRSMYFEGVVEKKFLFIKYRQHNWVTHHDSAKYFSDYDDAQDCIRQNRLRGVEIIEKEE